MTTYKEFIKDLQEQCGMDPDVECLGDASFVLHNLVEKYPPGDSTRFAVESAAIAVDNVLALLNVYPKSRRVSAGFTPTEKP